MGRSPSMGVTGTRKVGVGPWTDLPPSLTVTPGNGSMESTCNTHTYIYARMNTHTYIHMHGRTDTYTNEYD